MMGYNGGGGAMMLVGGVVALLLLVAVVLAIVWLVRALLPGTDRTRGAEEALAMLKRRYAAGEISHVEYIQARRLLGETNTSREMAWERGE